MHFASIDSPPHILGINLDVLALSSLVLQSCRLDSLVSMFLMRLRAQTDGITCLESTEPVGCG